MDLGGNPSAESSVACITPQPHDLCPFFRTLEVSMY